MERQRSIDAVAGIMIIYMIAWHFGILPKEKPFDCLFFFMPWFFYKSGIFYKKKNIRDYIIKGVKKLLYPYVIFSFLGWCIYCLCLFFENDVIITHYILTPLKELVMCGAIQGNLPLWFLLTLFCVTVCYAIFDQMKLPKYLVLIFFSMVAFFLSIWGGEIPDYLKNTALGIVFYTAGNIFSLKQYKKSIWGTALVISILIYFFCNSKILFRDNTLISGNYCLAIIFSISASIAINAIFDIIKYKFYVLTWIGRNAIVLYLTHWLVMSGLGLYFSVVDIHVFNYPLLLSFFFVVLSPILVYIFTYTKFRYLIKLK